VHLVGFIIRIKTENDIKLQFNLLHIIHSSTHPVDIFPRNLPNTCTHHSHTLQFPQSLLSTRTLHTHYLQFPHNLNKKCITLVSLQPNAQNSLFIYI